MSGLVGGIDDLMNLFGKIRMHPKPLKLQLKLVKVHKSRMKRFKLIALLPWNIIRRGFMVIGSRPNAGLMVHEKIILQSIIGLTVGIWVYSKLGWTNIWFPFLDRVGVLQSFFDFLPFIEVVSATSSIDVGLLIIPFVILTIITVTNAVNLTDGMDGLSSGLLVISFLAYLVISYSFSQIDGSEDYRFIAYLCATVSGSLISYLYFNIKPARVQLGDIGSLGLGTLLAVVTIVTHREFTLLLTAGVFIINGVVAPILQKLSKKISGKPIFRLTPLHYHFKMKGWSEEKVVTRFWIIGIILSVLGIWLAGL
jgi:phospho-N-acetylmuramoyl-pentapeptide-transferase